MAETHTPGGPEPRVPRRSRTLLRFWLGMAQMGAATVAAILLVRSGVSPAALLAVVAASTLTMASVLLFGSRRKPR
jgi:hypothetical protein